MVWVDIFAGIILFLSFISGLTEGAVKQGFSLVVLIIAVAFAGLFHPVAAGLLPFLPGNWPGFVGFFATMALASILMTIVLWLPRKMIQAVWKEDPLQRLIGGGLNLLNAAIGLTVLALVLNEYPIFDWLRDAVLASRVIDWLVANLSFVQALLPEKFQPAPGVFAALFLLHP